MALFVAARVLIPSEGMAVPLSLISMHAGLPRHAAQTLFNTTTDLATELVCRAWNALARQLGAAACATPDDVLIRLLEEIRADAAAHLIRAGLSSGTFSYQRDALAAADTVLALAVTEALRGVSPGLSLDDDTGGRALALARVAVLDANVPDARIEAAIIAAMLSHAAGVSQPACRRVSLPHDKSASLAQATPVQAAPVQQGRAAVAEPAPRRTLPVRPSLDDPPAGTA